MLTADLGSGMRTEKSYVLDPVDMECGENRGVFSAKHYSEFQQQLLLLQCTTTTTTTHGQK